MNSSKLEATLVVIKPDGIEKSLTGNIISRLSETQLKIVGAKVCRVSKELAETHYQHLVGKPFFGELIQYIMGEFHTKRVIALVYYGQNAIERIREISGATNPEEAVPYSLRGSYGRITTKGVFENVVHASSSVEDAEREIKLWFQPCEITGVELFPIKTITTQCEIKAWA